MRVIWWKGCLIALCVAGPASADEAQQAFDRLYGARIKAVTSTADPGDDVTLAKELLASAAEVTGQDALLAPFCNHAYTLGQRDPAGYETALAAMRLLAERVPAHAEHAHEQTVALLRTAYARSRGDERQMWGQKLVEALTAQADAMTAAGDGAAAATLYRQVIAMARSMRLDSVDTLQEKLKYALEIAQLQRRLAQLKSALEADASNQAAANELVLAYTVQLNRPQEAARYAEFAEPDLRKKAELAAKPVDELAAADALMLAQWHESLAASQPDAVRAVLLDRAAREVRRFLFAHDKQDLTRTTAELSLKRIEEQLTALQRSGSVLADLGARWAPLFASKTQLLPGVTGAPTPPRGTLKYEDGVLTLTEFGDVTFPHQVQHVLVRVDVKLHAGGQANINLRMSKEGKYILRWFGGGRFAVYRTVKGQGSQIADVTAEVEPGEWMQWTVAALEDVLIVYADGQEVLRVKDDQVPGEGAIKLYATGGGASFRNAVFMAPSRAQVRKLVESGPGG